MLTPFDGRLTKGSSVWLTIAKGEPTLEQGQAKASRVQSITVDELCSELDEYIKVAASRAA